MQEPRRKAHVSTRRGPRFSHLCQAAQPMQQPLMALVYTLPLKSSARSSSVRP